MQNATPRPKKIPPDYPTGKTFFREGCDSLRGDRPEDHSENGTRFRITGSPLTAPFQPHRTATERPSLLS